MNRLGFVTLSSLALALPAHAGTELLFSDASGLSAEAEFTLSGGGSTLTIRLKNTSTGAPMGFGSADQILTSVSFDLGAAGENMGDPAITGGSATTGPMSASVNFDVMNVGSSADVSGEYGFGNGGATGLKPNYVSGNTSGVTPFGGANLDGPASLNGPQGGLVANPAVTDLGGLGAIQDEVIAVLSIAPPLADLSFLANGVTIEYGSDMAFLTDEPCGAVAGFVKVSDSMGLNANDALCPAPGELPILGVLDFTLQMDDPTDACDLEPGSLTFVVINEADPIELYLNGFGCMPGSAGALLVDIFAEQPHHGGILPWTGPGNPVDHDFAIPNTAENCGIVCRAQGVFWRPASTGTPRIVLTNRVDLTLGADPMP